MAYSVITAEFLEAFNLTDVAEATQWSVNSSVIDADGTQRAFGTSVGNGGLRTRGLAAGLPTRNFFPAASLRDRISAWDGVTTFSAIPRRWRERQLSPPVHGVHGISESAGE